MTLKGVYSSNCCGGRMKNIHGGTGCVRGDDENRWIINVA